MYLTLLESELNRRYTSKSVVAATDFFINHRTHCKKTTTSGLQYSDDDDNDDDDEITFSLSKSDMVT